mmetsp:Transcript_4572/g.9138  ORF Transcript_4572/g.9138 Transcript_4572/m.9138 type:complete len:328 (-) Transcript_4572:115-1098(-)
MEKQVSFVVPTCSVASIGRALGVARCSQVCRSEFVDGTVAGSSFVPRASLVTTLEGDWRGRVDGKDNVSSVGFGKVPIEMKKRKRKIKIKYEWEVAKPKLLVFDLEGTLWEPDVETVERNGGGAPYTLEPRSGDILDRNGLRIGLIGDTRDALYDLFEDDGHWAGVKLAAISNDDHSFETTKNFLKMFRIDDGLRLFQVFDHIVLKRGTVKNHLEIIRTRTGIEYQDMLYYDNQRYNVAEAQDLGCCALYVKEGFAEGTFTKSLDSFTQFKRQHWRLAKPEKIFKNTRTGFKWMRWSGDGKWFVPSKPILPREARMNDDSIEFRYRK